MLDTRSLEMVLAEGISLIPVRDDNKAPFSKWKEKPTLDIIGLADGLFKHKSSSVAMRLGTWSKRLICIDVDTKYKSGFDIILCRGLMEVLPTLWDKFRIERTPSGGLHILYRIEEGTDMPGCGNLASRMATEQEMLDKPDSGKTRCFLEIKAEGGLSNCFPTKGYVRTHDRPIPILSRQDHDSIIELCRSYDEIVKTVSIKSDRTTFDDYYAVSPFDAFDKSMAGSEVLNDAGWTFFKSVGDYDQYIKPGKSTKDVGATFNAKGCYYRIHTTSTDLEVKSYTPSSLLCTLQFSGDKKKLYQWLVAKGYGKLKPHIEQELIERAAKYGNALPNNVSAEGKELLKVEQEKLELLYPYGVFWTEDDGVWKISREDLYRVASSLGYRKWKEQPVYIDNYIIKRIEPDEFYDGLKKYIKEDSIDLLNAYENFLQNSGKFTISRLNKLDKKLIFRSEKYISYKFFANGFLEITKDKCELKPYSEVRGLVWEEDIRQRNFEFRDGSSGLYYTFLNNALGGVDEFVKKCIGFYAHDYRDQEGYLIVTSEKCENPEMGGGNGKGIFWSLLGLTTTFRSIAASMIKTDSALLQSWNNEHVFVMSDTEKNFNWNFFKDLITDGAVIKKLYENEYSIDVYDMPKFGASTNYSVNVADGGSDRRYRFLEFTDFYKVHGGVKKYHSGKMFPLDWEENDYIEFDNVIVDCIQEYLKANCIIDKKEVSEGGWIKQFDQVYGHLREYIEQHIDEYCKQEEVRLEKINQDYNIFVKENNIGIKWVCSMTKINKAFKDYSKHHDIEFDAKHVIRIDPVNTTRGRLFKKIGSKKIIIDDMPF